MENPFLKTNLETGTFEFSEVGEAEVLPIIAVVNGLCRREELLSEIVFWIVVAFMVVMAVLTATTLITIFALQVAWASIVVVGWICFKLMQRKYRTDILRDFDNAFCDRNVRQALRAVNPKAADILEEIWKWYGVADSAG